jgi:hypothetical protein
MILWVIFQVRHGQFREWALLTFGNGIPSLLE